MLMYRICLISKGKKRTLFLDTYKCHVLKEGNNCVVVFFFFSELRTIIPGYI